MSNLVPDEPGWWWRDDGEGEYPVKVTKDSPLEFYWWQLGVASIVTDADDAWLGPCISPGLREHYEDELRAKDEHIKGLQRKRDKLRAQLAAVRGHGLPPDLVLLVGEDKTLVQPGPFGEMPPHMVFDYRDGCGSYRSWGQSRRHDTCTCGGCYPAVWGLVVGVRGEVSEAGGACLARAVRKEVLSYMETVVRVAPEESLAARGKLKEVGVSVVYLRDGQEVTL